jgi:hypothetical protein
MLEDCLTIFGWGFKMSVLESSWLWFPIFVMLFFEASIDLRNL